MSVHGRKWTAERKLTIRNGNPHFPLLEIPHLVYDLLDEAFELAHLRLEPGEGFLVGDGVVVYGVCADVVDYPRGGGR